MTTKNMLLIRMKRDYWLHEWIAKENDPDDYIHIHKDEICLAFPYEINHPTKAGTVYEVRGVWVNPIAFEVIA